MIEMVRLRLFEIPDIMFQRKHKIKKMDLEFDAVKSIPPPWDWRKGKRLAPLEEIPIICSIKGNTSSKGERCFRTEGEVIKKGRRKSKRYVF